MVEYHKHKGVESKGKLKLHPISTQHKDTTAKRYHTLELKKTPAKKLTKKTPAKKVKNTKEKLSDLKQFFGIESNKPKPVAKPSTNHVMLPIDSDGYITLNVDTCGTQGIRVSFTRDEYIGKDLHKKTVGLQIDAFKRSKHYQNIHDRNAKTKSRLVIDKSF